MKKSLKINVHLDQSSPKRHILYYIPLKRIMCIIIKQWIAEKMVIAIKIIKRIINV